MKRLSTLSIILVSLLLILGLSGCGGGGEEAPEGDAGAAASSEPLKVTLPTWTGYGPLFLAQEKGLFEKHGVEVELSIIDGLAERKQALAGGKVDGMATAQDVQVTLAASGIPVQVVWLLDDSYGGDGILVKNEIETAQDLKGKQVAFEVGSTSHLLMLTVLKQAGLEDKDVTVVPMSAGDAGAAFMAGKIDAAVTWEPWLTKGAEADGKVLVSTKDLPGIIVDSISFREQIVKERPEDVQAFVNAMAEAMDYWKDNAEESEQIMADGLKIDVAEFTGTTTGLKFFDKEDNKANFGSGGDDSYIYKITKNDIDFYIEQGIIEEAITPESIINADFVNALE